MIERSVDEMQPGDVLVFRLKASTVAKHAAIVVDVERMIHAQEGVLVSEVHLGPWWRRRIAGVFMFPGVSN
jgi:NlpC/P60 family putative phage cell wall peptidase